MRITAFVHFFENNETFREKYIENVLCVNFETFYAAMSELCAMLPPHENSGKLPY